MDIPLELRYTKEHEWIRVDGETATVGITDFAQDALGDIVFVDLPDVGVDAVQAAQLAEIESTKSVSEIYAPVTGTVYETNSSLDESPELVNTDPFGAGWLLKLNPFEQSQLAELLEPSEYRNLTE